MKFWMQTITASGKGRRVALQIVAPLVVLVLMMMWLKGAFRRNRIPAPTKPVTVAVTPPPPGATVWTVTLTPREQLTEMVGEVKPEFLINVSSKITAVVDQFNIRAGAHVQRDQTLATLDDREAQARLRQAEEALAHAVATRTYARLDAERDRKLAAQGAIPVAQSDLTQTRLKEAEAEVARLEQARTEAAVNLSYTKITSPVDGVVVDRLANTGDLATPGKPLLVMFDPQHLWLQASVREQDADRLKLGQSYRVRVDALDWEGSGPLVEIVPAADTVGRTVWARVRLPVDARLYPGLFGRLWLPTGTTEELLIPRRAVRQVGQLDMVDVQTAWGVEQRAVILGRAAGDRVEILSGLKPGEQLLVPAPQPESR